MNDSSRTLFRDFSAKNNIRSDTKPAVSSEAGEELSGTSLSYAMMLVYCICRVFNIELLNEYVFRGSKSYLISAEKGEAVPLYRIIGRSMENTMRLCLINVAQVFDVLGIGRKAKKLLSFGQQLDLLSQYLICTDV